MSWNPEFTTRRCSISCGTESDSSSFYFQPQFDQGTIWGKHFDLYGCNLHHSIGDRRVREEQWTVAYYGSMVGWSEITNMGKAVFNDNWLEDEKYWQWLKKMASNHEARCALCKKTIQLGTMGHIALDSHRKCCDHIIRFTESSSWKKHF